MSKLAARQKVRPPEGTNIRTEQGTPASAFTPETPVPAPAIPHPEIAARAYQLFLARGGTPGKEQADWFQAEAVLRREKRDRASGALGE